MGFQVFIYSYLNMFYNIHFFAGSLWYWKGSVLLIHWKMLSGKLVSFVQIPAYHILALWH